MKIEVARDKFLSNYEVYTHLKDIQQTHKWDFDPETKRDNSSKKYRQNHLVELELITRDLYSYLAKSEAKSQDQASIKKLIYGLQKYELEKIEILQMLNFSPKNMVLLYTIIEECDQRYTEEQCEEMLLLINECFGNEEQGAGDEEEGEEQSEEAQQDVEMEE